MLFQKTVSFLYQDEVFFFYCFGFFFFFFHHTKALTLLQEKNGPNYQVSSFNSLTHTFGQGNNYQDPSFGKVWGFLCQHRETHSKILRLKTSRVQRLKIPLLYHSSFWYVQANEKCCHNFGHSSLIYMTLTKQNSTHLLRKTKLWALETPKPTPHICT